MKSPTRILTDAYSSLCRRLGGKPAVCPAVDPDLFLEAVKIQKAGKIDFDNSADFKLGGVPLEKLPYSWPDNYLYHIENARMVGDQGFVFLPDGRIFEPSCHPYKLDQIKLRYPLPWSEKFIRGTAFHLTGNNHENRGHFMQDHIPRLLAAEKILGNLRYLKVIVAPGHRRWQMNFLTAMGVRAQNVIEAGYGTLEVEELLFAPLTSNAQGFADPQLYKIFQERISTYEAPHPTKPRVLFLSRKDAPDRRLSNEDQLIALIRELLGETEIATLSQLTLSQQIAAYDSADIIISPTGQAVTNVLMVSGKKVAVLLPGDRDYAYEKWAYSFLSFLGGNTPLMFYANTPVKESRPREWEFPVKRLRELIENALKLGIF